MEGSKSEVPQNNVKDVAHMVAGVAVSTAAAIASAATGLPILGAGELFRFLVTPSLEKRRDIWMGQLQLAVEELQRLQVSIDSLQNNEEFQTLLAQASQIAIKTHLQEKQIMLKNALVNSFKNEASFDISSMYLNMIDRLMPAHMNVLKLSGRGEVMKFQTESRDASQYAFIERIFKEVSPSIERSILEVIVNELEQMGLVGVMHKMTKQENRPISHYMLTGFGAGFLDFVTATH
jgi:hypothetical protein